MGNEINPFNASQARSEGITLSRSFISGVFLWMFLALAITAITAFYFASTPSLLSYLISTTGLTTLGWIVLLAPIGFVLLMSFGYQKLSAPALTLLFAVYSILMGMSLSFIFLLYTSTSIFKTFVVASAMFGIMAVAGYTTKIDLTRFGSIMFMGLIGIIIASLINIFLKSNAMDFIISFIGVLVFTGLTAYDVQKLKNLGNIIVSGSEPARKMIIMGSLTLYLDFINLFLFLLRFLGNRK
jgi:FtsH-binding integral membrane protein